MIKGLQSKNTTIFVHKITYQYVVGMLLYI